MVDPSRNRNPPPPPTPHRSAEKVPRDGERRAGGARTGEGEPEEVARKRRARAGGPGGEEAAGLREPDMAGGG